MVEEAKVKLLKKKGKVPFLTPPWIIGYYYYKKYQSMLTSIENMDECFFDEMNWRSFDPYDYHKEYIQSVDKWLILIDKEVLFEDEINKRIKREALMHEIEEA